MIDPPDRSRLLAQVAAHMEEFDERHGPATTRWQRFRRWRFERMLRRRLFDRHFTRWT